MSSRVVITGLGPVCAIGTGATEFWNALLQGKSALTPIEAFNATGFRSSLAGQVKDANIRDYVPKSYRKATKVMARDTELAVIAAKLAANDASLITRGSQDDPEPIPNGFTINPARTGCQIGAGLIAADTEELARAVVSAKDENDLFSMKKWGTQNDGAAGMNNLPPLWLLKYLPNMLACHVTIIHGLEGPSNTIMGAEASAILSIGESARVIERGSADICFTGGAESRINPLGLLRWDYSGRLAPLQNESDVPASVRPYDPSSAGGVMGESGGMLVIEDEQHATDRGANIYACIEGFGAAQTPPPVFPGLFDKPESHPCDRGLQSAIESALNDAQTQPGEIDLIISLGLGVPNYDDMELGAIRSVFDMKLKSTPIYTLANAVGNTLAGHGGLMTAAGALCLKHQILPAGTLRFEVANDHPTRLDESTPHKLTRVLVCSGSLGGQTGALVLTQYN